MNIEMTRRAFYCACCLMSQWDLQKTENKRVREVVLLSKTIDHCYPLLQGTQASKVASNDSKQQSEGSKLDGPLKEVVGATTLMRPCSR